MNQESKKEFIIPTVANINLATARMFGKGGFGWPRIQQSIEFAREMGVTKVGLAVCIVMIKEGQEFARFLEMAGFEVVSVCCMLGGLTLEEAGIPGKAPKGFSKICNPIAQAEIMNREGTQLNFIFGLCPGHDTMFSMYAKAPGTCVVAKDSVTGHNPCAALYSSFHRQNLARHCQKS